MAKTILQGTVKVKTGKGGKTTFKPGQDWNLAILSEHNRAETHC